MTEEKTCQYLPEEECIPEACLNVCGRRMIDRTSYYPKQVWNEYGNFVFRNVEEEERFIKDCTHPKTTTFRGCDGVVVFERVECDRCGLVLKRSGEVVWNK